jgi:hypothetical protein
LLLAGQHAEEAVANPLPMVRLDAVGETPAQWREVPGSHAPIATVRP